MKANKAFEWAVVGAGPAGIAAVGLLLDSGVQGHRIAWIDPAFKVGDFGTAWKRVVSNTPVESFIKFYKGSKAFQFGTQKEPFFVEHMKPEHTCPLMVAAQPLHWITERLKTEVQAMIGHATRLTQKSGQWQLTLASGETLSTGKAILAIGAEGRTLSFAELTEIPLNIALDSQLLQQAIQAEDRIAVFGDAQSASSVLEFLEKCKVRKIYHFYHTEYSFERHLGSRNLSHVTSVLWTPENLLKYIPECNKSIYAIGFKRRQIAIDGLPDDFGYDAKTGIIAPGIFGAGIAFPEIRPYELGRAEYRVSAIWPFMKRMIKLMPLWLNQKSAPHRIDTGIDTDTEPTPVEFDGEGGVV